MFDIGFWELCVIGLVSLIVIGPERLPKAARIAGFWVGKTRNMVQNVKTEIKDELQAEELRQTLKEQQAKIDEFKKLSNTITDPVSQLKDEVIQEAKGNLTDISDHDRK